MSGPISVTKITADTVFERPDHFELNIKVPFEVWRTKYDLSRLGQFLEWHFSDWDDGRYPFDTELFKHALEMAIKNAIWKLVSDTEFEIHKGEYVEEPNGKTAKACYTMDEILKKMYVCIDEGMKFAVKPVEKK